MHQGDLIQLVKRCKKHNQIAQIAIYDLFFEAMYNTAFRIVQQQDLAEDITQDAFIIAFSKVTSLQEEITFPKWFKQIVVNKSLTHLKQKKRFYPLDVEKLNSTIDDEYDHEFDTTNIGVQKIIKTINSLKDNYRILLTLHYIEGYDYEEIVEITGFTHTNCRTLISRAKSSLRKKLDKCQTIAI